MNEYRFIDLHLICGDWVKDSKDNFYVVLYKFNHGTFGWGYRLAPIESPYTDSDVQMTSIFYISEGVSRNMFTLLPRSRSKAFKLLVNL